ncbi:MAG: hypothetical protein GKR97_10215 [Rhizobiaceae bacterium]|nr:hypothetical protein [Rhizobiaceae bacterium]
MKLEIKNLKTMQGHDCLAFSLTLYIDGKRSMTVRNDGNGGCHFYELGNPDYNKLKKMADALPMVVTDIKNSDGTFFEYQPDVDHIIDRLIDKTLASKKLKRLMKKKTVVIEDSEVSSWSGLPNKQFREKGKLMELRDIIAGEYPNATILNELAFDDAVELCVGKI